MKTQELPFESGLLPLLEASEGRPGRALLESSLTRDGLGRYSIFGYDPLIVVTACPGGIAVRRRGSSEPEVRKGDSWDLFCALHRSRSANGTPTEEFPFSGGALGYVAYEAGLGWEGVKAGHKELEPAIASFSFAYHDRFLVADEVGRRLWAVADAELESDDSRVLEELVADVVHWRTQLVQADATPHRALGPHRWLSHFTTSYPREDYRNAVRTVRDYIASGDVYQVNLAQRYSAAWQSGNEIRLYRELRRRSPAPYASFLDVGGGVISVGCSPERFLRVRGREVSTRPIKGTRPRGATASEDAANRLALLESEKDRAELLMIVDLERNDLGRVCVPGSIRVDGLHTLEEHPTVFHLVAEVKGTLAPGRDMLDVVRASFPGGSITGAPKIRAMQIIAELETAPRGVYTGAVGYLGRRGECELNIAIRTLQCVGDRVHLHAGSGVVWDSEPDSEFDECLAKARAMAEAVVALSHSP
jgi:para-aminobenzoate synthetase component I